MRKPALLAAVALAAHLIVTFAKKGKFPYLCTVPGHAAAGMKGTFTVRYRVAPRSDVRQGVVTRRALRVPLPESASSRAPGWRRDTA
jgi:Copper binding proteins, plastocyanin/azurin family